MDGKCEIDAIQESGKKSFLPTAEPRNRYRQILEDACERAQTYLADISDRRVGVAQGELRAMEIFAGPLPEDGLPPADVLRLLDQSGSAATMATMGGRFFGGVIGGSLPVSVAAHWLRTPGTRTRVSTIFLPFRRIWRRWCLVGSLNFSVSLPEPQVRSSRAHKWPT